MLNLYLLKMAISVMLTLKTAFKKFRSTTQIQKYAIYSRGLQFDLCSAHLAIVVSGKRNNSVKGSKAIWPPWWDRSSGAIWENWSKLSE